MILNSLLPVRSIGIVSIIFYGIYHLLVRLTIMYVNVSHQYTLLLLLQCISICCLFVDIITLPTHIYRFV